jgi:transglutaminase-like putative cysteine protease
VAGAIIAAIAVILALLLLMSPWFWVFMDDVGLTGSQYDERANLTVTRTISFSVTGPWTVDYVLDVPLPKSISDGGGGYVQEMTKTDPDPTPLDEFKYGQHWMVWESSDSSGRTFTIDYEFEVQTVVWDIGSSESADVADIPQDVADRYTGAEWKINPDASGIADLSDDIVRDEDGVRDKLKAIYDYISANIEYETGGDGTPKDCTATLADGTGDCDDQSILFCSLARAAGIPSWLEFGALYDRGGDVWGGHAWVKAYVPLKAGGGGTVCIDVVNREFLVRPCNRFADWECDGNGTHMEDYYNTLAYSSMHSVSLDYSESYDGEYEPSGGKVSAPGAMNVTSAIMTAAIATSSRSRQPQTDL